MYASSWKLSLSTAVSAGAIALMLLVCGGCGKAEVVVDRQPDAEVVQVAAAETEPTTDEDAKPRVEEEVTVLEADKISASVDLTAEDAKLIRAESPTETPLGSPEEQSEPDPEVAKPTHRQVATISVNSEGLEETSLHCFCLSAEGNILAACGEEAGEVRVFDSEGKFLSSWKVSVKPEAISVGSDGNIYIAGQGRLLKLNNQGEVLLEKESPHVAALMADPEKIRKEVVEQAKEMTSMYDEQLEMYQKMIDQLREKDEAELTASEKQSLSQLEETYDQFKEMAEENGGGEELTEERIDELVASTLEYKKRTASISESNGSVFLATGAPVGYGFEVWRLDSELENGETIVSGLRGCCGQMDVQACPTGIYVAENSRHRVVRYDPDGEKLTSWGSRARSGLRGFGSCCNPMNVAFGPDGSVYTSESNLGRIKRYNSEGELLDLVGKVDLVPGCKKVAISVNQDGSRVYMLDITRNTILVMGKLAPGETIDYVETDQGESVNVGSAVLKAFKNALGF